MLFRSCQQKPRLSLCRHKQVFWNLRPIGVGYHWGLQNLYPPPPHTHIIFRDLDFCSKPIHESVAFHRTSKIGGCSTVKPPSTQNIIWAQRTFMHWAGFEVTVPLTDLPHTVGVFPVPNVRTSLSEVTLFSWGLSNCSCSPFAHIQ
jgi:hypothetical protein